MLNRTLPAQTRLMAGLWRARLNASWLLAGAIELVAQAGLVAQFVLNPQSHYNKKEALCKFSDFI